MEIVASQNAALSRHRGNFFASSEKVVGCSALLCLFLSIEFFPACKTNWALGLAKVFTLHSNEENANLRNVLHELDRVAVLIFADEGDQRRIPVADIVNLDGDALSKIDQSSTNLVLFIQFFVKVIYPID